MEYIRIGKIVNTHGIKGEVRILSDFKFKSDIFKVGNKIYIGSSYIEKELTTYRIHKEYDMVTFKDIANINDVLIYKGKEIYINREDYNFDGYLDEDIIGMAVYNDEAYIGKVDSIMKNRSQSILVIVDDKRRNLIPFVDEFILSVDINDKKISVKVIEGLLNED